MATKKQPVTYTNYLHKAYDVSGQQGARGNTYGTADENFQRIANLWNAQLGIASSPQDSRTTHKLRTHLTKEDVALLMIQVKASRLANCPSHEDSWIDIAGYVNCVSQIQQGE